MTTITVAITGASGAQYGLRLLDQLVKAQQKIYLLISAPGQMVLNQETTLNLPTRSKAVQEILTEYFRALPNQIRVFGHQQWTAPIASGSAISHAMVVCPCTSGTLSAISQGFSRNLIERAADVTLKEKRQLILVHRETPLSVIHLENMLIRA